MAKKKTRTAAKKTARKTSRKVAAKKPAAKAKFVKAKDVKGRTTRERMAQKRADLLQPGHVAIDRLPEPHRSIARAADAMIRRVVPDAESVVKWGNPCYYSGGRAFAALGQTKAGINLALPGASLDDPHKLLQGTGKSMRHVKLHDTALASNDRVAALVRQGVKIGFDRM